MAVFLVAYDLINERQGTHDYQPLWEELKRLGAHRTQLSLWLVSANNTVVEVRQHFQRFVDNNDRIWVTRLHKGQYDYCNAIGGSNNWLRNNPPDA